MNKQKDMTKIYHAHNIHFLPICEHLPAHAYKNKSIDTDMLATIVLQRCTIVFHENTT